MTDKNGVFNSYTGAYGAFTCRFIGTKNGMRIYQEQNTNMFRNGQDILYFSGDFSKINWKCCTDKFGSYAGCIRVFHCPEVFVL